ncbi:UDP-N-acetylmuramoylalanyl-D-glutamyl-2,6-diaminopimelate--D-alanyl-D-alanine ligase [Pelagibius sp. Alg239-R121]|uniref:UDP-N-acetylmuramoylalanyl-D-glutamyl-2, 6-diaminopimelate--D-alanyl-D-alanine ligase n=1 Tax=Pelagibius sp. Alg239-R121 TaxID=2993448 RepID=UPI0024A6323B|nr:UDP-N-acetylmuramoylalanyl-D-glutamyl-2,6-diaminopimelate--D-alanyl-D-alanine ligase [Pelagibius sp. Alg239-R121]
MNAQPLWTSEEVAAATGGINTCAWQADGLSINTRTIEPGELFIALQGPVFDGHDFIADALAKGAAAALVHRRPENLDEAAPLILVDDTLGALWRLGAAAHDRSSAKFIAVTGSVGKTGTKEALRTCLSPQAATFASAKSLNNHWGVPLSLARMLRDTVYGVFELGMNHPGEIRELARLVKPDVAIITTIEAAHMEFFESLEAIADAKAEIFESLRSDGTAVLNADNGMFDHLVAKAKAAGVKKIVSFGRNESANNRLLEVTPADNGSDVTAVVGEQEFNYRVGQPGDHWVMNTLAVLTAIDACGADVARAAQALAALPGLAGRGERHEINGPNGDFLLIDDAYNANPASVRAAISVLAYSKPAKDSRRIAVLGDMLELGKDASKLHGDLVEPLIDANVDLVFTCGPLMETLHKNLPARMQGAHAEDSAMLAPIATEAVAKGDVILVKGSLGSRMAVIVEALKALEGTNAV